MLPQTKRGNSVYIPDGEILTDYFWDRSELMIIQGPIESGTSTASCMKVWAIAEEQQPDADGVRYTRWLVVRETYKLLRQTTIKTWLDWFPESEWGPMIRSEPAIHHLKRRHSSGDGTLVDCEVIFIAIPDADVAEQICASWEFTGFFYNEGQFSEKGATDELLSRTGRYPIKKNGPGATWSGGFIDLNAPREGHWIPYMRGDMSLPQEWTQEAVREFTKPEGWKFFVQPPGLIEKRVDGQIAYIENPLAENSLHRTKTYLKRIEGQTKEWIDRRVMNKVGLYSGGKPVYPTFSTQDHIAPREMQAVFGAPIIVGLDFGREPAAAFMQCVGGRWVLLSELIGNTESAQLFAPKVKRHLAQQYRGHAAEFWGDPRGADGNQSNETTAYDVFQNHGMRVLPATSDNNPQMRRSTVEAVLERRNSFQINPSCLTAKTGFAGGYHYPKIKGLPGVYSDRPRKNVYSHIVEAVENAFLGGGEGDSLVMSSVKRPKISAVQRHHVQLRRRA